MPSRLHIIYIIAATLLAMCVVAWLQPAKAQTPLMCGKFETVLMQWALRYKEIPVAGDFKGPVKFILFMSPEAAWTMFYVRPDGVACFQASGRKWETFKPEIPGEKS